MGTQVPPEQPILDPALWYEATINLYGLANCTGFVEKRACCQTGAFLIDYINNDRDCTPAALCGPPMVSNAKLLSFRGPFATLGECQAAP